MRENWIEELDQLCALCGKPGGRHGSRNGECPAEDDPEEPPHRWHPRNTFTPIQAG